MEKALAHWSSAPIEADVQYRDVRIVLKRAAKDREASAFGFALCELSGKLTGMFVLVRKEGAVLLTGYTRRGSDLFDFPGRPAADWDSSQLLTFARDVIDRDFIYPPEWKAIRLHDDIEARAAVAENQAIAQLRKKS